MRRLLFMMLTMLSVLGVEAQTAFGTGNASSWNIEGSVMKLEIGAAGDLADYVSKDWGTELKNASVNGNVTKVVVTTANGVVLNSSDAGSFYWVGDAGCIITVDFSNAGFADVQPNINFNINNSKVLGNIVVPSAFAAAPSQSGINLSGVNYYGKTSDGINAVINNPDKLAWSDVRTTETQLVLQSDVTSELDLSGSGFTEYNFTNINISANITVPEGSAVSVADESAKAYIKGTDNVIVGSQEGAVLSIIDMQKFTDSEGNPMTLADILDKNTVDENSLEIIGHLTSDDLITLKQIKTRKLDLIKVTVDNDALIAFDEQNDMLVNIILPNDVNNVNEEMFSGCSSLRAAISTNGDYTLLNVYSKVAGSMVETMRMIEAFRDNDGVNATSLRKITLSGVYDIAGIDVGMNGDKYWTVENPKYSGLKGAIDLEYVDLRNAEFNESNYNGEVQDIATVFRSFSNIAKKALEFYFPESMSYNEIPSSCLEGCSCLTYIYVPSNYEYIREKAFYNCSSVMRISTSKATNSSENVTDHGEGTITLSANVKKIENSAFGGIEHITDVYVLATTAPECAGGAFDPTMTCGDHGFKGNTQHPICRENYRGGAGVIALLHYPRACTKEEMMKYKDITRKYTLLDETGATDGLGDIIAWPRHAEFERSWYQAVTETSEGSGRGYLWGAWKEKSDDNKWEVIMNIDEAKNYDIQTTDDYTYDLKYQGWHEFVLAKNFFREVKDEDETPIRDYSKFKENDWYSVCVPYNMTRSQLLNFLGAKAGSKVMIDGKDVNAEEDLYPDVRTLVKVERSKNDGLITFVFSENLTEKKKDVKLDKTGKTYEYVEPEYINDDDPIIIKGGYPYLVKPYLPSDKQLEAGAGNYLVNIPKVGESGIGNYILPQSGQPVAAPYANHMICAVDVDATNAKGETVYAKTVNGDDYYYHFVGTYSYKAHKLPKYSFSVGKNKVNGKHELFRTTLDNRPWGRYTAIIGGRSKAENYNPNISGTIDKSTVDNISLVFECDNDYFDAEIGLEGDAKFAMSFDDEDHGTTAINEIEMPDKDNSNRVYGLDGRCVGSTLKNLPKGIYIKNGKKYIVEK